MKVTLPHLPCWENDAIRPAPELLDELADRYCAGLEAQPPETRQFLFGFVPLHVFDGLLAGSGTGAAPEQLWLMHVSGYLGGVWLRSELIAAQPDSAFAKAGLPPSREAFLATARKARASLDAAAGGEAALWRHLEAALPELVASFGYNRGYLIEIVEAPPLGVASPRSFVEPRGLLWCDYAAERLHSLAALGPLAERVRSPDPGSPLATLCAPLPGIQQAAEEQGHRVWSTGLSMQGFAPDAYRQLLDVSGSFLEVIQATAITAVGALADRDAGAGRRAAGCLAAIAPWLGSYALGLMDPAPDGASPRTAT